jgi:L-asparaginase
MLEEMGVVFGQDLPGPKARIKLMVALGLTSDPAEIRRIFADGAAPAR